MKYKFFFLGFFIIVGGVVLYSWRNSPISFQTEIQACNFLTQNSWETEKRRGSGPLAPDEYSYTFLPSGKIETMYSSDTFSKFSGTWKIKQQKDYFMNVTVNMNPTIPFMPNEIKADYHIVFYRNFITLATPSMSNPYILVRGATIPGQGEKCESTLINNS